MSEFSVFYAARFGSDLWFFFFSLGFLGPIVELFFLFCFAAQEDFVFCSLASSFSSSRP